MCSPRRILLSSSTSHLSYQQSKIEDDSPHPQTSHRSNVLSCPIVNILTSFLLLSLLLLTFPTAAFSQATINSVQPYVSPGSDIVTIYGASLATSSGDLLSVTLTDNGGTSYQACSSYTWQSAASITCTFTWIANKNYNYQVASTSGGTIANLATTTKCLPVVWQAQSYGAGSLVTPGFSPLSIRGIIDSSLFTGATVGTGLVFRMFARPDNGGYVFQDASVALRSTIPANKKDVYPLTVTSLKFGNATSGSTTTMPASGSLYSDPVDFCVSNAQASDLAVTYHIATGTSSIQPPFYQLSSSYSSTTNYYVQDSNDNLAYSKAVWSSISGSSASSTYVGMIWQILMITAQSCTTPTVTSISPTSFASSPATVITLTGTGFGSNSALLQIGYIYGGNLVTCASSDHIDSTHVTCLTNGDIPMYTSGVTLQVFVSGVLINPTQTFSVTNGFTVSASSPIIFTSPGSSFPLTIACLAAPASGVILTPSFSISTATTGVSSDTPSLSFTSTISSISFNLLSTSSKNSQSFTLSFTLSGTNAGVFTAPSTVTVIVPGVLTFAFDKTTLYTTQSGTLTATPSWAPPFSYAVASCSANVGTISPSTLNFTSSANRQLTYTAAGTSGSVTVTCSFPSAYGQDYKYFSTSTWTFTVSAPVAVSLSTIPSTLYVNQQFNLSASTSSSPPLSSISLRTSTSSAGSISPSYMNFTSSIVAATSTVIAPSTTGFMLLDFQFSGADNGHYITPASVNITILPQATVSLVGFPTQLFASQTVTLWVILSAAPNAPVHIDLAATMGTMNTTFMQFDVGQTSAAFIWTAPGPAAGSVTFSGDVTATPGTDFAHYSNPASVTKSIAVQDTITIGAAPSTIYANQAFSIQVSPNAAPLSSVQLNISSSNCPASIVTTGLIFTATTPQSLQFVAPSSAGSCTFTFSIPTNLVISQADCWHYIVPSNLVVTVTAQSSFTLLPTPASLYTNQVWNANFWPVATSTASGVTVTLTVLYAGTVNPNVVSFSNTVVNSSLTISAPPTVGNITIRYILSGSDKDHYVTPADTVISVVPQFATSIAGFPAAMFAAQTYILAVILTSPPTSTVIVDLSADSGSLNTTFVTFAAGQTSAAFAWTAWNYSTTLHISGTLRTTAGTGFAQFTNPPSVSRLIASYGSLQLGPMISTAYYQQQVRLNLSPTIGGAPVISALWPSSCGPVFVATETASTLTTMSIQYAAPVTAVPCTLTITAGSGVSVLVEPETSSSSTLTSGASSAALTFGTVTSGFRLSSSSDSNVTFYLFRTAAATFATRPWTGAAAVYPLNSFSHTYAYDIAIHVPFAVQTNRLVASYCAFDSIPLLVGSPASFVTALSGNSAGPFSLPLGVTPIVLNEDIDGYYSIHYTRANIDLQSLQFAQQFTTLANTNTWVTFTPSFAANSSNYYSATVSYLVADVSLNGVFSNYNNLLASSDSQSSITLAPSTYSAPLALHVGLNILYVNASEDGMYQFAITRLPQDIITADMRGLTREGTIVNNIESGSIPAFSTVPQSYSLTVPHDYNEISFNFSFQTTGSMSVAQESPIASLTAFTTLTSASWSLWYPLSVSPAVNIFIITSARDGNLTIAVTRSVQDVTSLQLYTYLTSMAGPTLTSLTPNFILNGQQYSFTASVPFVIGYASVRAVYTTASSLSSLTLNSTSFTPASSTSLSASMPLGVGSNLIHLVSNMDGLYSIIVYRASGDVAFASLQAFPRAGSTLPSPSPVLTLSAPFTSAVYFNYSTTVPYVYDSVSITALYSVVGSVVVGSSSSGSVTSLASNSASSPIALAVGSNTVTLYSSQDGNYTFTVIRLASELTVLNVFSSFYPNFSSTPYTDPTPLVSSPTFVAGGGKNIHIDVSYLRGSAMLLLQFLTPLSVNVTMSIGSTIIDSFQPTSTVPSNAYLLSVTPAVNTFYVSSTRDGDYSITITRAIQDMFSLTTRTYTTANNGPFTLALTPSSFPPNQFTFNASVPYLQGSITFTVGFLTPASILSISDRFTTTVTSVSTGVPTIRFPLQLGETDFDINSLMDGVYRVSILRRNGDVSNVATTAYYAYNTPLANAQSLVYSPQAFQRIVFINYTASVPYKYSQVSFNSVFGALGSMSLYPYSLSNPSPLSLTTTVESALLPLSVPGTTAAVNSFYFSSTEDGIYTVVVTRLPADMFLSSSMVFTSLQWTSVLSIPIGIAANIPLVPTPALSATNRFYSLQVPFQVAAINFQLHFLTPSTVTYTFVTQYANVSATNVADLTPSIELDLTVNYGAATDWSVLTLTSTLDGLYRFNISRAQPDVQLITVMPFASNGFPLDASNTASTFPLLNPAFAPGMFTYDVKVDYIVSSINVAVYFGTNQSILVSTSPSFANIIAPLPGDSALAYSGMRSSLYPLPYFGTTLNVLYIHSTRDGSYAIQVIRSAPDITSIALHANGLLIPLQSLALAPSFSAGSLQYNATVPFGAQVVQLEVDSVSSDSRLRYSFDCLGTSLPSCRATALPIRSLAFGTNASIQLPVAPLTMATHTVITVYSFLDGNFTIQLTQSPPEISDVDVTLLPADGRSPPAPASFNVTALTVSDVSPIIPSLTAFPANFILYNSSLVYPTQDLLNSFIPGITGLYTAHVPYLFDHFSVASFFGTSATVSVNLYLPTMYAQSTPVNNGSTSPSMTLAVGWSAFVITSPLDGIYQFRVERLPNVLQTVTLRYLGSNVVPVESPVVLYANSVATSFQSTQYLYNATVPFLVTNLKVLATFNIAGNVKVLLNSNDPTTAFPLMSGVDWLSTAAATATGVSINVGVNILTVFSATDGVYQIVITRLPPTIVSINVLAILSPNVALGTSTPGNDIGYLQLTPPFVSGEYANNYTSQAPYVVNRFAVLVNCTAPTTQVTITITNAQITTTEIVQCGVYSSSYPLPFLPSPFSDIKIDTPTDSTYSISIQRLTTDVSSVQMIASSLCCGASVTRLSYNPAIGPGVFSFFAIVPYGMDQLALSLVFGHVKTVAVSVTDNYPASPPTVDLSNNASIVVSSVQIQPSYNLFSVNPRVNYLTVNSEVDGTYIFTLLRALPDVQSVSINVSNPAVNAYLNTFISAFGDSNPDVQALSVAINNRIEMTWVTSFVGGSFSYDVQTGYIANNILVSAAFSVINSASLDTPLNGLSVSGAPTTILVRNQQTSRYLYLGVNLLKLISTLDGIYSFRVQRRLQDMVNIEVRGAVAVHSANLLTKTFSLVNSSYTVTPPFVPLSGQTSGYVVVVPYIVSNVQLRVTYGAANSIAAASISCAANAGSSPTLALSSSSMTLASGTWSGDQVGQGYKWTDLMFLSNVGSGPSHIGCVVTVLSLADGLYSINVQRQLPDVRSINLWAFNSTSGDNVSIPLTLSPAFIGDGLPVSADGSSTAYVYNVDVPNGYDHLQMSVNLRNQNNLPAQANTVDCYFLQQYNSSTTMEAQVSNDANTVFVQSLPSGATTALLAGNGSPNFPLRLGLNLVSIRSQFDGNYSIIVFYRTPVKTIVDCLNFPCQNGGVCQSTPNPLYQTVYTCQCPHGFDGVNCENGFTSLPPASPPVSILSAPALVTDCDSLVVDGSASYYSPVLPPSNPNDPANSSVYYWWKLVSVKIDALGTNSSVELLGTGAMPLLPLSSQAALNEMLPLGSGGSAGVFNNLNATVSNQLTIAGSSLLSNCTYTFSLQLQVVVRSVDPTITDLRVVKSVSTWSNVAAVSFRKQGSQSPVWSPRAILVQPSIILRPQVSTFDVKTMLNLCAPLPALTVASFLWTVTVSASNGLTTLPSGSPAIGSVVYTSTERTTNIPVNTLFAGVYYDVVIAGTWQSPSDGVATSSSTKTVLVSSSPIVASIVGSDRVRNAANSISIDASTSYDPDDSTTVLSFRWNVRSQPVSDPTATLLPVTLTAVQSSSNVLVFPAFSLTSDMVYTCTVVVSAPQSNRTSFVSVKLTTFTPAPGSVPIPDVSLLNAPINFNPQSELNLYAYAVTASSTPVYALKYFWSCPTDPTLSLQNPLLLSSLVNSTRLILKANLLQPGKFYTCQVQVYDPLYGPASMASATATFYVIQPPSGGKCTVAPVSGVELQTSFTIGCTGWSDPQGFAPLQYVYQLKPNASSTTTKLLAPMSFNPSYVTSLPAGLGMSITVSIYNSLGSAVSVDIPVDVTRSTLATVDPVCFVANASATFLQTSVNNQLDSQSFLYIQSLSDLLNGVPNPNSTVTCGTLTTSAAALRLELLQATTTVVGTGTLSSSQISFVTQSLQTLTADPIALTSNSASWQLSTNLLQQTLSSLSSTSSQLGSTQVTALTQTLAPAVSQLLTDCSRLDAVQNLTQELLSSYLSSSAVDQVLPTLDLDNMAATVSRTNLQAGTAVQLSSGVTVVLTAEALAAYSAQYNTNPVTSSNLDTAQGLNAINSNSISLDTRVVTYSPTWSACRNSSLSFSSNSLASDLTHIDVTLSNGQVVNIADLAAPITFFIPLRNDTLASLQYQLVPVPCSTATQRLNMTEDEAAKSLSCSFYDPTFGNWSSDGCVTNGLTSDKKSINCSCGHLTEFAILHHQSVLRSENDGCDSQDSVLGHWVYLLFLVLYLTVSVTSGVQLTRIVHATGHKKHWLMVVEHALIMIVALLRAFNMLNFYTLYNYFSLTMLTISSGLPHLGTSWIFSFVIFAWAFIYHSSMSGIRLKDDSNPLKESGMQSVFYLLNSGISLTLFVLFVLMGIDNENTHPNIDLQSRLYEAGIYIISVVSLAYAIFFMVYGWLLVRSLTKDFSSPYARKLFLVATCCSLCFLFESALLLYSVIDDSTFNQYLIKLNSVYFSLDLAVLCTILALFAKSISELQSTRKGMHKGSTLGSMTAATTHGRRKSDMLESQIATAAELDGVHLQNKGEEILIDTNDNDDIDDAVEVNGANGASDATLLTPEARRAKNYSGLKLLPPKMLLEQQKAKRHHTSEKIPDATVDDGEAMGSVMPDMSKKSSGDKRRNSGQAAGESPEKHSNLSDASTSANDFSAISPSSVTSTTANQPTLASPSIAGKYEYSSPSLPTTLAEKGVSVADLRAPTTKSLPIGSSLPTLQRFPFATTHAGQEIQPLSPIASSPTSPSTSTSMVSSIAATPLPAEFAPITSTRPMNGWSARQLNFTNVNNTGARTGESPPSGSPPASTPSELGTEQDNPGLFAPPPASTTTVQFPFKHHRNSSNNNNGRGSKMVPFATSQNGASLQSPPGASSSTSAGESDAGDSSAHTGHTDMSSPATDTEPSLFSMPVSNASTALTQKGDGDLTRPTRGSQRPTGWHLSPASAASSVLTPSSSVSANTVSPSHSTNASDSFPVSPVFHPSPKSDNSDALATPQGSTPTQESAVPTVLPPPLDPSITGGNDTNEVHIKLAPSSPVPQTSFDLVKKFVNASNAAATSSHAIGDENTVSTHTKDTSFIIRAPTVGVKPDDSAALVRMHLTGSEEANVAGRIVVEDNQNK